MLRTRSLTILTAALALLFTAACAPHNQSGQSPNFYGVESSKAIAPVAGQIIVADSTGTPIPDATVLIGPRENVPFPGNLLKTDANGVVKLPAAWTDAQPVTIEASAFVRTTWMSQAPTASVLSPRRKPATQRLEFKGKTTGYTKLKDNDDWLDVGVVFPALRRDQLASLQVTDLISPEIDQISILGQTIEVPSNISIPKQVEHYYFNVTIDKPIFRTYLKEARTWKMAALHARFPWEQTVDDLRAGKSFYDVLNAFEFQGASVADVSVAAPSTSQDMGIADLAFDAKLDVAAPKFASKYTMLAVAVSENAGLLYPTDVKKLAPSETRRLVTPKGVSGYIVGALRETAAPTTGPAADALSAVIAPNNMTTRFEFLDVPGAPKPKGSTLVLDPPKASVAAVTPAATYATLNKVDKVIAGKSTLETKSPVWDVYSNGWTNSMDLPDFATKLTGTHRWEVLFGGAPTGTTVQLGPNLIDGLTHLSKSAADL
jgi:hypothetical protein